MSRDWKPGDVAMVTWDNESEVRVLVENGTTDVDFSHRKDAWWGRNGYLSIAATGLQARPLVVIDPENREQVERLAQRIGHLWKSHNYVRDVVQTALREFANPTPPRPDEPTGLGAVVEDAAGRLWVRHQTTGGGGWYLDGASAPYDDIAAVQVLSEGIQ